MEADTERRIAALLRETGNAHGEYEQRVLGGVRDEDWATWYADYLVAHGFGALLGQRLTAERTRQLLLERDAAYQAGQAGQAGVAWPEAYARDIVAALS